MSYEQSTIKSLLRSILKRYSIYLAVLISVSCTFALCWAHNDCDDIIYYPATHQKVCEVNLN